MFFDYRHFKISGSYDHPFAISEKGSVFGYGKNIWGQLGNGLETYSNDEFSQITTFNQYKIVSAYAGFDHSLFQTSDGRIFVSGQNEFGQLFSEYKNKSECIYQPIETEIKSGSCFCVAGSNTSSVFINYFPKMSPNICLNKFKKITQTESQKPQKSIFTK